MPRWGTKLWNLPQLAGTKTHPTCAVQVLGKNLPLLPSSWVQHCRGQELQLRNVRRGGAGPSEETHYPSPPPHPTLCSGLRAWSSPSWGRRKVLNMNGIRGFKITQNGNYVFIKRDWVLYFYESDRKEPCEMRARGRLRTFPQNKFNGRWCKRIRWVSAYTPLSPVCSIDRIIFLSYCCSFKFFFKLTWG